MRNAFDQLLCFCDSNAENKSKMQGAGVELGNPGDGSAP